MAQIIFRGPRRMKRDHADFKYKDLTGKIIGAGMAVQSELGFGFAEKVYENALVIELESAGLAVQQQVPTPVYYRGELVGDYFADLIVEGKVIVELRAVAKLDPVHEVQLVNYLKATELEVGLLLNFGDRLEYKRRVFSKRARTQMEGRA
ncbi:MAG: GxxExxY protein [Planctomycetota bacterium]